MSFFVVISVSFFLLSLFLFFCLSNYKYLNFVRLLLHNMFVHDLIVRSIFFCLFQPKQVKFSGAFVILCLWCFFGELFGWQKIDQIVGPQIEYATRKSGLLLATFQMPWYDWAETLAWTLQISNFESVLPKLVVSKRIGVFNPWNCGNRIIQPMAENESRTVNERQNFHWRGNSWKSRHVLSISNTCTQCGCIHVTQKRWLNRWMDGWMERKDGQRACARRATLPFASCQLGKNHFSSAILNKWET